MKVGFDCRVASYDDPSGIKTYTYGLLGALSRNEPGLRSTAFYPSQGSLSLPPKIKKKKVNVLTPFFKVPIYEQFALKAILEKGKYDIFHFLANTAPALARPRKTKVVLTLHDALDFEKLPQEKGIYKKVRFYQKLVIPRAVQLADSVIVPSLWVGRQAERLFGLKKEKVRVIYEGLILSKPVSKKLLQQKYGLPEDFILTLASFSRRKNLPVVFKALERLDAGLPLVVLLSQNELKEELLQEAADIGLRNVYFLPAVAPRELAALYKASRVFLYPSLSEGFGLPVIEALASGTAVVCSDRGALPEIGGSAPTYVDSTNFKSVAQALDKRLREPEDKKRKLEGIRHARTFSWARCARQTMEVYRELLG